MDGEEVAAVTGLLLALAALLEAVRRLLEAVVGETAENGAGEG